MRKIKNLLTCCLLAGCFAVWAPFFEFQDGPENLARAESADRNPAWAQPVELADSDNFYRVTDDLYRSAQPSAAGMRAYERFGIRTVINLRGFHTDDDVAKGTTLKLVHIPVHTWEAGQEQTVITILQAIRDAEKPVLVHCQHGADRTGLSIAMYRMVEQGLNRAEAMEEMRNGGYGFHSVWRNIPRYIEAADLEKIKSALR